ncbi:MAG: DNA replication/repair protein RecF [Eubacterium sp.]|nr:DNA replication/repair protein RecF [Eubacterium sp.]
MYIESLALKNFRNYELQSIEFSDHINILYGDNAQGKTNILEAIYLVATTRSHRGARDKDIIRFGENEAYIKANIKKREVSHRVDVNLRKQRPKGVAIDGIPIRRSIELFGMINIVIFSPEDMSVVKEGPSERRRFMDSELCQLSRLYFSNLAKYNHILEQRNSLLKQIYFKPELEDSLDIWDDQLIETGRSIIRERSNFIKMMNDMIIGIHKGLTSDKEIISLKYEPNVKEEDFENVLKSKRKIELKNTTTMTGPHRDDFGIIINDIDVRVYGSQGQQRTAALSLKMAEIELVKDVINDSPILLLDDVMSELDSKRRDALLNYIQGIQTIITCTGYDDFIKKSVSIDKKYRVVNGSIS